MSGGGLRLGSEPSVNIATVADRHNQDNRLRIRNLIDDAVVPYAYPIQVLRSGELLAAGRTRIALQGIQASGDSGAGFQRQLSKRAFRRWFEANLVHASTVKIRGRGSS